MAKTLLFGKYKGHTIAEVLAGDPEYLCWLCSQDEFRSSRGAIYRDIIDCVEGLVDAPERKVMRAWFQDLDFCRRFLRVSGDRKSTRLNSSHLGISYAVFCLKKKTKTYD